MYEVTIHTDTYAIAECAGGGTRKLVHFMGPAAGERAAVYAAWANEKLAATVCPTKEEAPTWECISEVADALGKLRLDPSKKVASLTLFKSIEGHIEDLIQRKLIETVPKDDGDRLAAMNTQRELERKVWVAHQAMMAVANAWIGQQEKHPGFGDLKAMTTARLADTLIEDMMMFGVGRFPNVKEPAPALSKCDTCGHTLCIFDRG